MDRREVEDSGDGDDGDEDETPRKEEEAVPTDQRPLLNALKSMERRTMDGKLELPIFSGKMDPNLVMDWIEALTSFFECEDILEHQRVKMARSKLKGAALTWCNLIQTERVKNGKSMIRSWNRMIALIKETYVLEDYGVQLHRRKQNLKKKDMDVSTYTEEFLKLCIKAKTTEIEEEKLARYINGLKFSIQDELNLHTLGNVHKCYQMELKVEEKFKKKQDQNNRGRGPFRGRGNNGGSQGDTNQEDSKGEGSNRGSFRGRRPNYRGRSQGRGPIRCYNCNQEGHIANRCPEKANNNTMGERKSNLIQKSDYQSVNNSNTFQSVNAPDSYGYPERGEALMMRRALLKVPITKEPPQRKAIFKTTCKSRGKVCKVMIDSSSIENFVSMEMVEKLKLKRIPHPYPYKVSWLTQGQQALVEEQAWAQHDGFRNTYSITKDGKIIELLPLMEDEEEPKGKEAKVMLMERKEFMKEVREEGGLCFALIPVPKKEAADVGVADQQGRPRMVPYEVQELLDKYKGVISKGMPKTLPPIREISHCIDFIPGATLPNKAAYKLTPQQNEEVATQIADLLNAAIRNDDLEQQADANFPKHEPPTLEKVLDTKVVKKTRNKEYTQYLVKWKGKPNNEAVWMDEKKIEAHDTTLQQLISSGLEISCPQEYDAGASSNPTQSSLEETNN
ncbi:uncharacterized protein LOC131856278 [Cryptomeria japonica]|uniref:uncharacterized protein LOC131856278 n=1 Tax=Cryptomeria japonica TaxID=3369 RepID=UPI0027DAAE8E|nr:uncharacterized protein LOC131856278 [Cryptomeria japonica]